MRPLLLLAFVLLATHAAAEEPPVGARDFFPFGVYAGGNGPVPSLAAAGASLEEQIDFLCQDLVAHNFNTVWANNLSPEHFVDHAGRPLPHYEEAGRVSRELEPLKPLLLRLRPEAESEVVYWENRPQLHGRTFVHGDTGDRYLMTFNADVDEPQSTDLEFGYFAHYLTTADRFYDVLTGDVYDGSGLKNVVLPPGDGRLYLIGQTEAWERHVAWTKTRGKD